MKKLLLASLLLVMTGTAWAQSSWSVLSAVKNRLECSAAPLDYPAVAMALADLSPTAYNINRDGMNMKVFRNVVSPLYPNGLKEHDDVILRRGPYVAYGFEITATPAQIAQAYHLNPGALKPFGTPAHRKLPPLRVATLPGGRVLVDYTNEKGNQEVFCDKYELLKNFLK